MSCDANTRSGQHLLEYHVQSLRSSAYGYRCHYCWLPMGVPPCIGGEADCPLTPQVEQEIRAAEIAALPVPTGKTVVDVISWEECFGYWRRIRGDRDIVDRGETCDDQKIQERWAGWLAAEIHEHEESHE